MEPSNDSVSIIAHKVRTPLTVVSSTANNFLDGVYGALNEDQRTQIKKLESHVTQLAVLVDQILQKLKENPQKSLHIQRQLFCGSGPHSRMKNSVESQKKITEKSGPIILVVDDETDIQDVVREGLEVNGFQVHSASTAEQALKLSQEVDPDVILMDLFLGKENGFEVAKKIKLQCRQFKPVIMITGQDDLRGKIAMFHDCADDLLAKPFQIAELGIRVASMLRLKKLYEELGR